MSMYMGGSEKNIARAFREAEQEGALLLIDEVDSFLQDRRGAQRSWEVSMVNEMLTRMEAYSGVFIASTNLMDDLDQAALHRFDLKVKFDYLHAEQAWSLLQSHCAAMKFVEPQPALSARLARLQQLTPEVMLPLYASITSDPYNLPNCWLQHWKRNALSKATQ